MGLSPRLCIRQLLLICCSNIVVTQIHLAPVLPGAGVRLFDHLGVEPQRLEILRVVAAPDVTHLLYRAVK